MGSLPPQGNGGGILASITNEDEALSITASYSNALVIDSRSLSDNVITLYNADATADLHYKIYATAQGISAIPADNDNSWINILDREVNDPSLYDHNTERVIPPLGVFYESFSNKWSWVRVMMKSSTGTITAKIWHRGTK